MKRTIHCRRIFKAPMEALCLSGKNGATFPGVVADGEDVAELVVQELIH